VAEDRDAEACAGRAGAEEDLADGVDAIGWRVDHREERGEIDVKGKGRLDAFLLVGRREDEAS
jgi:hypothetical protein